MFRTIRVHLGPLVALRNSVQNGPNKCKSSCHEVASEFFATNAPDPPPLDPKLTFWCISNYLGAFRTVGCLTKLGAKQAELVQKFVPRSRVGIFRNERTRSNPLDLKLTFLRVLYYLGAFGTVRLPYETWCKMGELVQKFMTRSRIGIFRIERTRSTHWTLN